MNELSNFVYHHDLTDFESNRSDPRYFHINVVENAVDSLETAGTFFARVDNLKWKWISIAIHHALYSFSIAGLVNGNYENVLSKGNQDDENIYCKSGTNSKCKKAIKIKYKGGPGYIFKWEEISGEPQQMKVNKIEKQKPKTKLIGFWTALARVQDSVFYMGHFTHTKAVTLSEDEWESILWSTQSIRNNLVHFIPTLSAVSIKLVKKACIDTLRIIGFLAQESYAIMYDVPETEARVKKAILFIHQHLKD